MSVMAPVLRSTDTGHRAQPLGHSLVKLPDNARSSDSPKGVPRPTDLNMQSDGRFFAGVAAVRNVCP